MEIDPELFKRGFKEAMHKNAASFGDWMMHPIRTAGIQEANTRMQPFEQQGFQVGRDANGAPTGVTGFKPMEDQGIVFNKDPNGNIHNVNFGQTALGVGKHFLGQAWDYTKQHPWQVGGGAAGLVGGGLLLHHLLSGGGQQPQAQPQYAPAYSGGGQGMLPSSPQAIQKWSMDQTGPSALMSIPHSAASFATGSPFSQLQTHNKPQNVVSANQPLQNSMTHDYIKHLLTAQQQPSSN